MGLKNIPKFEKANNISISVYGYQKGKEGQEGIIHPLKVTKEMNERHVNLLPIADDDTNHYCFIKNFSKDKQYFCRFCLHYTSKGKAQHRRTVEEMEKKLKVHEENCVQHNGCINK